MAWDLLENGDPSWQQKEEKGRLRIPEGFRSVVLFCSFVSCLLYKKGGAPALGARTHVTLTPVTECSLTTLRGVRPIVAWFLEAADRRRKEVRLTSADAGGLGNVMSARECRAPC